MVPSPGTGRFTVMSDRVEIERLIKDFGLFNNELEESEDVSLPPPVWSVRRQLHRNQFDLLYLLCADSHTAVHLNQMDSF